MRPRSPAVLQVTALDTGGALKVVERLLNVFEEPGRQAEILILAPQSKWINRKIYNLFSKIDLEISAQSMSVLSFSTYRGIGIRLLLSIYQRKIRSAEIVHMHWLPGLLQSNPKYFYRLRTIWTIHDFEAFTGGCHQSYGCIKFQNSCISCPQTLELYHRKVEKSLKAKTLNVRRYSNLTIVVPSHWLASQVKSSSVLAGQQIHVIGNPIPTQVFNSFESSRNFKSNKVTVGLLGKNYPQGKGALTAVEFLAKFRELFEGETEVITFGSPHEGLLGDTVAEGSSDSEIAASLKKCDFFLFFSQGETFGNFVAEAAACGAIVISNGIGPIAELIKDEETGLLVKPKSESDLRRWVSLAHLESKREEMSNAAEEFIRGKFDSKLIAKKYLSLYESSRR
jgi:glycosyltransferase involved in cell wall biosynthesis